MEIECFSFGDLLSEYSSLIKQCVLTFTPSWKNSDDKDLIESALQFYSDKMPQEIYLMIKNLGGGFIKYPNFDTAVSQADMYFPYYSTIDAINPKFRIECMIYNEMGELAWTNEL